MAAQLATLPVMAFRAGSDPKSQTGWVNEDADATQFFNRKPFEITNEKLYTEFHPVNESENRRPDKYSEMAITRVMNAGSAVKIAAMEAGLIEDTGVWQNPMAPVVPLKEITEEDMLGLRERTYELLPDEYFKEHYDSWEAKGQDRLLDDIRTNLVRTPAQAVARANPDNKTFLALHHAYFNAYSDIDVTRYGPKDPDPLKADTQIISHGMMGEQVTDNREVVPSTGLEERLEFKSPQHAADLIKEVAHLYGATIVGITRVNPDFVYSRGLRGTEYAEPEAPADGGAAFLSDEEVVAISAAAESAGLDPDVVVGIFEKGKGEQMAVMAAVGEAGLDPATLMGAMGAAGIELEEMGQGAGAEAAKAERKPPTMAILPGDKNTGEFEVPEHWKYMIMIGIPHEWDQLLGAPNYADSVDAYTKLDLAGGRLSRFIKELGFASRAEIPPFYYDTVMPAHAVQAGLGQWGRHGCVISPETGANIRLAGVMTNLEMEVDNPVDLGIAEFCADCKICAELCPTASISFADSQEGMITRGYERWYINTSTCYGMWQTALGSGCRVCIAVCPYSRKDNWVHGIVRAIDPLDPTGVTRKSLIWMQHTFFESPEVTDFLPPPDGCYESYRPMADYLTVSKWFSNEFVDPTTACA